MISASYYLYGAQFPADFHFCLFITRPTYILFSSTAQVLLNLILLVIELGLSLSYKDKLFSLVVGKCQNESFELISSIQHFRAWLSNILHRTYECTNCYFRKKVFHLCDPVQNKHGMRSCRTDTF